MTQVLTSADFTSTIASGVTLVDFYADWCGPCQQMLPVIDELATLYAGRANITKVDVDMSGDIAWQFGIMSIPTLLIFKDGELVEKIIGLQSIEVLQGLIDKHIA